MFVIIATMCIWDCTEIKQWDEKNPKDPKVKKKNQKKHSLIE